MAGITVTREDLQEITGAEISSAKFASVRNIVLGLIRGDYRGDIDTATGRAADILNSVFISAALRLITNPNGARSVGLGSANVTFGGTDEDIAMSGSLSAAERKSLASLQKPRPSYVPLVAYDEHPSPFVIPPTEETTA